MNIIQPANVDILSKLERMFWNFKDNIKYKIASYVIESEAEDGTKILFNDVTKEIIALEPEDDIFTQFFLLRLFIVPEDFNDKLIPLMIRGIYESQRPLRIEPDGYTILTTTACNARCFYCYEKGHVQKPMSERTANDVADFIIANYRRKYPENADGGRTVGISWFGGEPLFRKRCINIICEKLKNAGIPYSSSMISNGYLFNEETVKEAVNLWNLGSVQITVDGTEEVYNKTKAYIYKGKNAYETVLNNIKRLTDSGITVSIRINIGMFNIDDSRKLVAILCDRFKGNSLIKIYPHILYETEGNDITDDEKLRMVYECIKEIENTVSELGFGAFKKPFDNVYSDFHCMADSGRHLCILTDGGLTLCEHYIDSDKICTIYDFPDNIDISKVKMYREIIEPYPQCYECPLLMDCSYLKVCADSKTSCDKWRKDRLLSIYKRKAVEKYEEYKQSISKNKGTD